MLSRGRFGKPRVVNSRLVTRNRELAGWLGLCAAFFILGALGLVGWQGIMWLRDGYWTPYAVLDGIWWITSAPEGSWIWTPKTWVGLHKLLAGTPLSAGIAVIGFLLLWLSLAADL